MKTLGFVAMVSLLLGLTGGALIRDAYLGHAAAFASGYSPPIAFTADSAGPSLTADTHPQRIDGMPWVDLDLPIRSPRPVPWPKLQPIGP